MEEQPFKSGQQISTSSESLTGSTGEVGWVFGRPDYSVADLFSSPIGIAEGSTVWVEEIIRIIVSLDDESLVDLDVKWFGGKPYLGTYRLGGAEYLENASLDPTKEGFINSLDTTLRFFTPYLVVSELKGEAMEESILVLDPCDFRLSGFTISTPPSPLPASADSSKILGTTQAFVGRGSRSFYPLGVGSLRDAVVFAGLYLNPGVSLIKITKTTRIAGQVVSVRPRAIAPRACSIQTENCGTLTSSFFSGGNERFRSFGEAVDFYNERATTDVGLPELIASIVAIEVELAPGCKVTYYTLGGLQG